MLDVLLVEGDKVLAELIKERLESSELRVFCTCSGAETLFFLESRSADLVLLNYKLPDYSGKTLIEKIHKSDSCPPFVIFTDPGEEGVILEMMKLGAIDYLVKDLFFKDLLPHVVSRVTAKIEMEQKFKRSEKTLYEREERINRAEIASKAGNWEFQLETNVMIASLGATKIYGVGIDRMDFEYVRNVPLPEYRPILDQALKNLIEKDEPYNLEFRIRAMDSGEIKDIHSIATYNREKRTLFGIIHDITEKKEIERKIKLMAHALESISECVSVTDTEDRIIYVNESVKDIRL
jgi:PAS domain S-box-containing protein